MRKIALLFVCLLLLGGCAKTQPITRDGVAMDTVVQITLYDTTDSTLLDDCFAQIQEYDTMFSRTNPQGDIGRLNAAGGVQTALSAPVLDLLAIGQAWGGISGGAFDITIAPASELWDFSAGVIPDDAALQEAVTHVDYTALTLTDSGAVLPAGMAVDLGGIAKGYTADRLAEHLRDAGVNSALIDLGGNILAVGNKNGKPFTIGIRDPFDADALAAVVLVEDRSVVTSGIYERSFERDGVTYHHLLDPATGRPVQNDLCSVTIVSASSVDGDALSTACFVLGLERGMALVEELDDVEALFITADGTLHPTAGLEYEVR